MLKKTIIIISLGILWANLSFASQRKKPKKLMGTWQLRTSHYKELKKKCRKNTTNCLTTFEDLEELFKNSFLLELNKEGCRIHIDLETTIKKLGLKDFSEVKNLFDHLGLTTPNLEDLDWFVEGKELLILPEIGGQRENASFFILKSKTKMLPKNQKEEELWGSFHKIK